PLSSRGSAWIDDERTALHPELERFKGATAHDDPEPAAPDAGPEAPRRVRPAESRSWRVDQLQVPVRQVLGSRTSDRSGSCRFAPLANWLAMEHKELAQARRMAIDVARRIVDGRCSPYEG